MCRRNQLWGLAVLAFGLGLVVGSWLEPVFIRKCCGIGLMAVGVLIVQKK